MPPALLFTLHSVKSDPALHEGQRGDRKLLVTEIRETHEQPAFEVVWKPPLPGDQCSVQHMPDTEVAVFTQRARQERHSHKMATEIYSVIEGQMDIEVEGVHYRLEAGDMIVVNPGSVHQVQSNNEPFLCQVVAVNCQGQSDKYPAPGPARVSE